MRCSWPGLPSTGPASKSRRGLAIGLAIAAIQCAARLVNRLGLKLSVMIACLSLAMATLTVVTTDGYLSR
jgi:hypothetical protein